MSISNLVNQATLEGNGVTTVLLLNFHTTTSDLVVVQTVIATGAGIDAGARFRLHR